MARNCEISGHCFYELYVQQNTNNMILDILLIIAIIIAVIIGLGILGILLKIIFIIFEFLGQMALYAISILFIGGVVVLLICAIF